MWLNRSQCKHNMGYTQRQMRCRHSCSTETISRSQIITVHNSVTLMFIIVKVVVAAEYGELAELQLSVQVVSLPQWQKFRSLNLKSCIRITTHTESCSFSLSHVHSLQVENHFLVWPFYLCEEWFSLGVSLQTRNEWERATIGSGNDFSNKHMRSLLLI